MLHVTRFEGIIIGYEDWGDVDRLISFYTPNLGKVEAVARGVRHEKSKLKGHVELLTHGEFAVARNRGRGVLTDALSYETFLGIYAQAERAYLGHIVAHFYDVYLYPAAPDSALWQLLRDTLSALSASVPDQSQMESDYDTAPYHSGAILERALDRFAKEFLRHLGYLDESTSISVIPAKAGIQAPEPGSRMIQTIKEDGISGMTYDKFEDDKATFAISAADFRRYDALLAQTDIGGPTFSNAYRNLAKISAPS